MRMFYHETSSLLARTLPKYDIQISGFVSTVVLLEGLRSVISSLPEHCQNVTWEISSILLAGI
jgi:hypothetical protein